MDGKKGKRKSSINRKTDTSQNVIMFASLSIIVMTQKVIISNQDLDVISIGTMHLQQTEQTVFTNLVLWKKVRTTTIILTI